MNTKIELSSVTVAGVGHLYENQLKITIVA